jgi:hypothetical protein
VTTPNLDRYLRLLDPNLGLNVEELRALFGLDIVTTVHGERFLRSPSSGVGGHRMTLIRAALEDPMHFALAPVYVHDTRTSCWWAPNEPQLLAAVRAHHDLDPNLTREEVIVIAPTLAALRSMS